MRRFLRGGLAFALILLVGLSAVEPSKAQAQALASRIALVIGNGAYRSPVNPTAPNDAGLVAQTLTAAGFDVSGARDLDGEATRKAFRDFLDRAAQLGPQGIAVVYLAGYGVQYNGENYFVPVDATLGRDTDVPIQAIRVADLTQALAGLPIQSRVVVLDAAYQSSFPGAKTLPGGFALIDPDPETLLAFNAAPGTVGPPATGSYGVYSQALAEMMRQGGVPVQEVFDRVRLRVNTLTQGADVPWNESKLSNSFVFLQLSPDAPPPPNDQLNYSTLEKKPIREFPATEAYSVAVARDSFNGYQDFLTAYPSSPYAARVRILVAARREALTWRKTVDIGTGDAYWSYLKRYRKGPHAAEARRRLRALDLALTPPPAFAPVEYDVPPPPEFEDRYVDEPVIIFNEADEVPPPPPPVYVLPPPDVDYNDYPPPPPPEAPGFLPIPIPVPIPYGRPVGEPGRLRPPPGLPGSYAQPQPFLVNPAGGLRPQPAPGVPNAPLQPRPETGQPVPPVAPVPGRPVVQPGLPLVPRPSPLPGQGVPAVPVLPNAGRPGVLPGAPGAGVLPPRGAPTLPAGPQTVTPVLPGRLGTPAQNRAAPLPGTPGAGGLPGQRPVQQPVPVPGRPAPATVAPIGNRPQAPVAAPLPGAPGAGTLPPRAVPALPVPGSPGQRPVAPPPGTPGAGGVVRPSAQQPVPPPGRPAVAPAAPAVNRPPAAVPAPPPGPAPAAAPVRPNVAPGAAQQGQQRQQADQARQQQLQQQQRQQVDQARQQQLQQQHRQQVDQARQQQLQQQQRQQVDQARQQQLQQQQRQQVDQARQQQLQQQQRQQVDQARQQQLQQQQRQQVDQARQQQLQQQQRQQVDQARQQQLQQQQRQQVDQARQQQLQQQQRPQVDQARQQQLQQQRQPAPPVPRPGPAPGRPECGKPGEPPCR